MMEEKDLFEAIYSIVLSMWEEEPDLIIDEVISRFAISRDYAEVLVSRAIEHELALEAELNEVNGNVWGEEEEEYF